MHKNGKFTLKAYVGDSKKISKKATSGGDWT